MRDQMLDLQGSLPVLPEPVHWRIETRVIRGEETRVLGTETRFSNTLRLVVAFGVVLW